MLSVLDVSMIVHVLHTWSYTFQFTKMLAQGKQKRRDMGLSISSLHLPMGFNYLKMKDILSIWKICGDGVMCLAGTCSSCLCCIWSFILLSPSHVSFRKILQIYLFYYFNCVWVHTSVSVCVCMWIFAWVKMSKEAVDVWSRSRVTDSCEARDCEY